MTDISDLREGDEIDVVMRLRIEEDRAVNKGHGRYTLGYLFEIAESITVVRPEIIPGQPYVDADGNLYIGRRENRVTSVNHDGSSTWYGRDNSDRPMPHGLRRATIS